MYARVCIISALMALDATTNGTECSMTKDIDSSSSLVLDETKRLDSSDATPLVYDEEDYLDNINDDEEERYAAIGSTSDRKKNAEHSNGQTDSTSTSAAADSTQQSNATTTATTQQFQPPTRCNQQSIDELLKRTNYTIVQENGQRKYAPSEEASANMNSKCDQMPPDRGCEVFVGKIPRDCFEDELIPVLERAGCIYEFRLMMEYSGYNRGYGFVMYTSRDDAKRAVRDLNNYEIRKGRMIGLCRSVDNCRLFVGGIPKNKKREEILEEMRKITDHVVNVIVYPSAHDKTKNRGFAFVQYTSHRAAAVARRKLIPARIQLFGQPIAVDWAEPEPEVDEDVMATVKVLYVRNLMLHTTEEQIKREFEKLKENSVERVKKLKDFAFVHFREREDALNAMKLMNGASIDDSVVEVTLSKPVDKSLTRVNALSGNSTSPNSQLLIAANAIHAASAATTPLGMTDLNFLLSTTAGNAAIKMPQFVQYPQAAIGLNDPNAVALYNQFQQYGNTMFVPSHQVPLGAYAQQQIPHVAANNASSASNPAPFMSQHVQHPSSPYFSSINVTPNLLQQPQSPLVSSVHYQFQQLQPLSTTNEIQQPQQTLYQTGQLQQPLPQLTQQQQLNAPLNNGTSSSVSNGSTAVATTTATPSSSTSTCRVLRANVGGTRASNLYNRSAAYNVYRGASSNNQLANANNSTSSIINSKQQQQPNNEDMISELYAGIKPVPLLPFNPAATATGPGILGANSTVPFPVVTQSSSTTTSNRANTTNSNLKSMVNANNTSSNSSSISSSTSMNASYMSVQTLNDLCLHELQTLPVYALHTATGQDQEGRDVTLFMYKITIPNMFNNEALSPNRLMRSMEDAKNDAAEFVLAQLNFSKQQQQLELLNNEFYVQQQQHQPKKHSLSSISSNDKQSSLATMAAIQQQQQQNLATANSYLIDQMTGQYIMCAPPQ